MQQVQPPQRDRLYGPLVVALVLLLLLGLPFAAWLDSSIRGVTRASVLDLVRGG